MSVRKTELFCKAYDCLIKTCSRHKCHLPRDYCWKRNIVWEDYSETCGMYKSLSKWRTLFEDRTAEEEDASGVAEDE